MDVSSFNLERFNKKTRETERGELMTYFCKKLNEGRKEKGLKEMNIKRVAFLLTAIPTKDLYYIQSVCDDWADEGKPWGALFWKLLKTQ